MTSFSWLTGTSADWATSGDWSSAGFPDDSAADVTVAASGSYVVSIGTTETIAVDSLTINAASATVSVQGTLAPAGALALVTLKSGTLALSGTLRDGDLRFAGGTLAAQSGMLDGVTVLGTFDLGEAAFNSITGTYGPGASVTILDGLTALTLAGSAPGAINVQAGALQFNDSETIDNVAISVGSTIAEVAGTISERAASGTLTLGSHAVLTVVGGADFLGTGFVNRGSIAANFNQTLDFGVVSIGDSFTNAGTFSINAGSTSDSHGIELVAVDTGFANSGTVTIGNRALLSIGPGASFSNTGTISIAAGGSLELEGNYSLAQLNAVALSFPGVSGSVHMIGNWLLGGGTLDVASFGNVVQTGTVENGTVKALAGYATTATLDGVTVLGVLRGAGGIENGLTVQSLGPTFPGTIDLTGSDLPVLDSETIDDVVVLLGNHTLKETQDGGTLTLGPGVTVSVGGSGAALIKGDSPFPTSGSTIVNQGTIASAGNNFSISGLAFDNAGIVSISAGAVLTLGGPGAADTDSVINTGTLLGNAATFSFNPTDPLTNNGLLEAQGGTVVVDAFVLQQATSSENFIGVSNLTNLSGATLTGGLWQADAGATLDVVAYDSIVTDAAVITLNGIGALIETDGTATAALETTLATIAAAGTLALLGGRGYATAAGLDDAGIIQLGGGIFSSAGLTLEGSGHFLGFGSIAGGLQNAGTVEAAGGTLKLTAPAGAGTLLADAGATLEIAGASSAPAAFGDGGTLLLDQPSLYTGTLNGFAPGDTLVLAATLADTATIDGGTLEVALSGGGMLDYALAGTRANDGVVVSTDTLGNSILTLAAPPPPPVTLWLSGISDDWTTAADWNAGSVPNAATSDAGISAVGNYTVTIAGGETITLHSLTLDAVGATLAVAGTLLAGTALLQAGALQLAGILKGGTIEQQGGTLSAAGGTLDGVTVAGTLQLDGGTASVRDGLNAGQVALGGGTLILLDSETLDAMTIGIGNGGSIAGADMLALGAAATVNVASNAVISAATLANAGGITIAATTLEIDAGASAENAGTIRGSGTLSFAGAALTNDGMLRADGGTLLVQQTGSFGFDALINYDLGTLTGGAYAASAGATLDLLLGGAIGTDAAALTLDGAGSTIGTFFGSFKPIESTLGSIAASGTLAVLDGRGYAPSVALTDAGLLELGGGSLSGSAVTIAAGGVLTGFGTVTAALQNAGTIEAQAALLTLGTLAGSGTLQVDSGGTLELTQATGERVVFNQLGGILTLDTPGSFTGTLSGFAPEDLLVLTHTAASDASIAGNTLTVTLAAGGTLHYALADTAANAGTSVTVDPAGDTEIGLQAAVAACFAQGTRVLTASGEVGVEALRVGDLVPTLLGRRLAPVRWIGHRRVDCRHHPRPRDVWPVRVQAGAFGPGKPLRTLLLSPDHAVYVDDVLIPIRYLMNGASIAQVPVEAVTYWHVELPAHDVLLADGLPAETFLDTGNRSAFENGGDAVALHADFARRAVALSVWARDACAPLLMDGPVLIGVKRRLLARAMALGHAATAEPDLQLVTAGRMIAPSIEGDVCRFRLPAGAGASRLVSRVTVPAEMLPDSSDFRQLGVAVAELAIDGTPLWAGDPRLGRGWHAGENAWRWTDGQADLNCAGGGELTVRLVKLARYWNDTPWSEAVPLN